MGGFLGNGSIETGVKNSPDAVLGGFEFTDISLGRFTVLGILAP